MNLFSEILIQEIVLRILKNNLTDFKKLPKFQTSNWFQNSHANFKIGLHLDH
jgi:hypothetical protein